jgi:hypothetical protein
LVIAFCSIVIDPRAIGSDSGDDGMSFIKKVVHQAINPFVDSGPFGAGPAFSAKNPRKISRGLFDLSQKTWTPPSNLFQGQIGQAVAAIGAKFPVLAVGTGSKLDHREQDFCVQLFKAAERSSITGDIDEPVYLCFKDSSAPSFDRSAFFHQLMDRSLADLPYSPSIKLRAVNMIAKSGYGVSDISVDQWVELCEKPTVYCFLQPDGFEAALSLIDGQSTSVSLGR